MGLCSSKKQRNRVWKRSLKEKSHVHKLEASMETCLHLERINTLEQETAIKRYCSDEHIQMPKLEAPVETCRHLEDVIYEDIDTQLNALSTCDMLKFDTLLDDHILSNQEISHSFGLSPDYGTDRFVEPMPTLYGCSETINQHKCLEYREMFQIFKPMIVQNLLVHDILPHLPFLDNHDEIYDEMKHHSQKSAVLRLLSELETCDELGKWQMFMDALYDCGYTYIVDNIRGYKFTNYHYQTRYIKRLTPVIGKMISPPELMPYLIANELLSDTDRDNILCECNNRGEYAGAVLLLDRITRKHGNWYMLFIKALEDANCHEVADNLRIKELMKNGRVKGAKDDDEYEEVGGMTTFTRGDYVDKGPVELNTEQEICEPSPVYSSVHSHISEGPSALPIHQLGDMSLSMKGCEQEPRYNFGSTCDITAVKDKVSTIKEENQDVRYKKEGYTIGKDRSIQVYMTSHVYDTVDEQHNLFSLNTVNRWFAGFVELSLDQCY